MPFNYPVTVNNALAPGDGNVMVNVPFVAVLSAPKSKKKHALLL